MSVTRRKALGLIGSALAAPAVLRPRPARAATITPILSPLPVDPSLPGSTSNPVAAAFEDGRFVIAFNQNDAGIGRAFARWFDTDGAPLGPSVQVGGNHAFVTGPVGFPDGRAIVVYGQDDGSGNFVDLFGQRFRANRTPLGKPFLINVTRPGLQIGLPPVLLANGNWVQTWTDSNRQNVFGRVLEQTGTPVTNEKVLASGTGNIAAALDRFGNNLLLAYQKPGPSGASYSGQLLSRNLNRIGGRLNAGSTGIPFATRPMASVAPGGGTDAIILRADEKNGQSRIFGRAFADGNLVDAYTISDKSNLFLFSPAIKAARIGDTDSIVVALAEKRAGSSGDRYFVGARIITSDGVPTTPLVNLSGNHTNPDARPHSIVRLPPMVPFVPNPYSVTYDLPFGAKDIRRAFYGLLGFSTE
jgi:hypothetical protein